MNEIEEIKKLLLDKKFGDEVGALTQAFVRLLNKQVDGFNVSCCCKSLSLVIEEQRDRYHEALSLISSIKRVLDMPASTTNIQVLSIIRDLQEQTGYNFRRERDQ